MDAKEMKRLRSKLKDINGIFWTDGQLRRLYELLHTTHGVISVCMEELAMKPKKARRWENNGISYTHYDYLEMVKHQNSIAHDDLCFIYDRDRGRIEMP